MSLGLRVLNGAYRLHLAPAWRRFLRAAHDPRAAQRARLEALLELTRDTAFAQEHRLGRVRTLADWQDAIPVRGYDELAPWIERLVAGEAGVLTREAPRIFERSSGSTQASKLIPYTPAFLSEFGRATGPWLYDLLTRRPALQRGSSYWSISPAGPRGERTPGGTPIGFADDTEYFPRPVRRLLRRLLPVPGEVARAVEIDDCRYASLRYLLADPSLAFVSVWSPSFLSLLLEFARTHADALAHDLERGGLSLPSGARLDLPPLSRAPTQARAAREAFPSSGPLRLERVWPQLSLVSCWADAAAARQVPALRALLPAHVELQPKGLLATEGVISFPLLDHPGGVLALDAHLLELQPSGDPAARPLAPHQVAVGERYVPILSTAGGLFRYRLGDEVEVLGRFARAPLVRFVGRSDGVSDLAGEKLSPGRVGEALARCLRGPAPDLAFLAPRPDAPGYRLYVELPTEQAEALAARLERALREGHHYELCRRLGQLEALEGRGVVEGWRRYEAALVARGVKAGDVKPSSLRRETWWDEVFPRPS